LWITIFAALFVVFGAPAVHADGIVITETTIASGSLDGTAFSDALVTLTVMGSPTNMTGGAPIFKLPGTATVSVAGNGTDTFTAKVVTPEPGSFLMLSAALLGLTVLAFCRKRIV
jgi:hypothetical protein